MKKDGKYKGVTNTGLRFEGRVDLVTMLRKISGYEIIRNSSGVGYDIFYQGALVASCFKKYEFYKFLEKNGIEWKTLISKRLLPDEALLVVIRKTLYIIEIKYQEVPGSVDEKLQTCDFKRKQYLRLVSSLGLKVEYVYVLNDWFKKQEYKDTLDYIHSVNCHYLFNELPLAWLGLPAG